MNSLETFNLRQKTEYFSASASKRYLKLGTKEKKEPRVKDYSESVGINIYKPVKRYNTLGGHPVSSKVTGKILTDFKGSRTIS